MIIRLSGSHAPSEDTSSLDPSLTSGTSIELFYYREDLDTDETGNILCSGDAVQSVTRHISDYSIDKHLQTLLAWPNDQEQAQWFSSEFPLSWFTLQEVELDDQGLLSLVFEDREHRSTGWSCRVGILANQLVKTAETISGVQEIHISPEDIFQP